MKVDRKRYSIHFHVWFNKQSGHFFIASYKIKTTSLIIACTLAGRCLRAEEDEFFFEKYPKRLNLDGKKYQVNFVAEMSKDKDFEKAKLWTPQMVCRDPGVLARREEEPHVR